MSEATDSTGGTGNGPEVWFYHLTHWPLERALPPLLEKTLERGWRALVRVGTADRLAHLDQHLWTWRDESFLPHGSAAEEEAEGQPILLTLNDENVNEADVQFVVDGAAPFDMASFARTILVFDGRNEDAVAEARAEWRKAKEQDLDVSYWQQTGSGGFEKKA